MSAWTMRDAAQVIMAGRRAARRSSQAFKIDRQRMIRAGFVDAELDDIAQAVDRIEKFTEAELSSLKRRI